MTRRQPKLPLALRIIAAGCVVLWLAGVSACNLEALFCCPSHDSETAAHENHEHSQDTKDAVAGTTHERDADADHSLNAEAHHPHDADGHSPDSNKHESKEGSSCCSTLKAVVPAAKVIVFNKPAFHPIPFLCVLLETHAASLDLAENPLNRQAKPRDWVFTHEVCTAPANRAHAPPVSV
jgi:hypothetical protein